MSDIILEITRSLILFGIIVYLFKAGRGRAELSQKGWRLIIGGFLLLLFGSVVDITDNFESLNRFIVIGDTPTQAFLEKLVGFLGGFILLAIGLVRWIPTITAVEEIKALAKKVENLAKFPSENPNPVMRVSTVDRSVLYTNKACKSELEGWQCEVGVKVPDSYWKYIEESVKTNQNNMFDVVIKDKTFSFVVALASENYVNLYGRDVTKERKVEQMKSDFVSLVSHQLKTPVAEMRGYVDNMLSGLSGKLTEKQKQYLQDMDKISSRNYRLISNLLNLSQIERGAILMNTQPFQLKEAVDVVMQEYRENIESKGLTLNFNDGGTDILVNADKDKTIEILSNIINNAIKFTEKGSITVTISADKSYGIVEVNDTGKGMSKNALEHLFEKRQAFSGAPTAGGGAGLGLYIAKTFMKLQKGDITVTSTSDQGSAFVVKIPLAKV